MPLNELRISGMLQAALIALALGAFLRGVPPDGETSWWPYALGGYGFLAATVPWIAGGLRKDAFSLRLSAILGLMFALPLGVSAYWLSSSAYRTIGTGCLVLVAWWAMLLLASVVVRLRTRE